VTLILGSKCYIANVGDCRAVLSSNRGKNFTNLTRDHKPSDEGEQARIMKAGGRVFQTVSKITDGEGKTVDESTGPLRVLPGRLSVSRTLGDPEAKLPRFGGNSSVVIS
jgi:protein phosphatase 2C family protein 2/3